MHTITIVLTCALVMMVIEAMQPGRTFPKVAYWYARALSLSAIQALWLLTIGDVANSVIQAHRLWEFPIKTSAVAVLVGYLSHSLVFYWWHRLRHASPLLWRWVHQMHHSPQRLEAATTFYKHPLESGLNVILTSLVLFGLVGLAPEDAAQASLIAGLADLFCHWNVNTPKWVGFFIQRPEAHCVHHEEGLHAYNYGDLPVIDWLFGTMRDPDHWKKTCGLGPANELRFTDMLVGVDVSQPEHTAG